MHRALQKIFSSVWSDLTRNSRVWVIKKNSQKFMGAKKTYNFSRAKKLCRTANEASAKKVWVCHASEPSAKRARRKFGLVERAKRVGGKFTSAARRKFVDLARARRKCGFVAIEASAREIYVCRASEANARKI